MYTIMVTEDKILYNFIQVNNIYINISIYQRKTTLVYILHTIRSLIVIVIIMNIYL